MSSSEIVFYCKGHPNIRGTHKTTLEFTKDLDLTPNGDCIIGVSADFSLEKLQECLSWKEAEMVLKVDELTETVNLRINPGFKDTQEMVIRMGDYASERTLGVRADKSSAMLDRGLMERLKYPGTTIRVSLHEKEETKEI